MVILPRGRKRKLSFERALREIESISEDDVFDEKVTYFILTGEPPDGPDEEIDPEGYRERVEYWSDMVDMLREEATRKREAAFKAWETRRKRYGRSGRRKNR